MLLTLYGGVRAVFDVNDNVSRGTRGRRRNPIHAKPAPRRRGPGCRCCRACLFAVLQKRGAPSGLMAQMEGGVVFGVHGDFD